MPRITIDFFFLFFISDKINNLMNYAIQNNVKSWARKRQVETHAHWSGSFL